MRKEELRHDPVRENIIKGIEFVNKNKNNVLKIFAVLAILVAVFSYYNKIVSVRVENSSNIAGLAQNSFVNGEIDKAMVKFERVFAEYPNTFAATQSLIYLLNDAINKEDYTAIDNLISKQKDGIDNIDDPVIRANINKIKGDMAMYKNNVEEALSYYSKAIDITMEPATKVKFQLDIILELRVTFGT